MAGLSDSLEVALCNHVLGGADYTRLATVYVALFTAAPTDAGGGAEVGTARGYARVAVTNNATNWPTAVTAAGVTTKSNGTSVTFGSPVTTNWGPVTHFGIMSTSGTATASSDFLYWGVLTNARTINAGDGAPSFAATSLVVTYD